VGHKSFSGIAKYAGTTCVSVTNELDYFAVSSIDGYIRVYKCRDLLVKGLTKVGKGCAKILFLNNLFLVLRNDGRVVVYRGVRKMRPLGEDLY
jgi:hypothetical protein